MILVPFQRISSHLNSSGSAPGCFLVKAKARQNEKKAFLLFELPPAVVLASKRYPQPLRLSLNTAAALSPSNLQVAAFKPQRDSAAAAWKSFQQGLLLRQDATFREHKQHFLTAATTTLKTIVVRAGEPLRVIARLSSLLTGELLRAFRHKVKRCRRSPKDHPSATTPKPTQNTCANQIHGERLLACLLA